MVYYNMEHSIRYASMVNSVKKEWKPSLFAAIAAFAVQKGAARFSQYEKEVIRHGYDKQRRSEQPDACGWGRQSAEEEKEGQRQPYRGADHPGLRGKEGAAVVSFKLVDVLRYCGLGDMEFPSRCSEAGFAVHLEECFHAIVEHGSTPFEIMGRDGAST